MTATNHDSHLGEIYPTLLNELNCTFGVSFSRFHCCGRHGRGLLPSWYRPNCIYCLWQQQVVTAAVDMEAPVAMVPVVVVTLDIDNSSVSVSPISKRYSRVNITQ